MRTEYDSEGDLKPLIPAGREFERYVTAKLERAGFRGFRAYYVDLSFEARAICVVVGTPAPHPSIAQGRDLIVKGAIARARFAIAQTMPLSVFCEVRFHDPARQ